MIVIFDIDGTLSIVGDRLKYLEQASPDWDAFYGACGEDAVNDAIWEIYAGMVEMGHEIYFVTGRRESCRKDTISWMLRNHIECQNDKHLLMRKDSDLRHDTEVKPELIEDFKSDILVIFEDRNSMVKKWRELGYTCLQVADGDF
jgi:acid phosphatase class B